jgi:LDH2 family malate/lactate/ureidoglycolate dehydrogenase
VHGVYEFHDIKRFAVSLLGAEGLSEERAETVGAKFLEADLLGFRTHGIQRLAINLEWLKDGTTSRDGEISIVASTATTMTWDANMLPGPWVAAKAVETASSLATASGTGTVVIRRSQHVACMAAYLMAAVERGQMIWMCASTPSEVAMCAHGGLDRIFSCNPITAGIPTESDPILIDTSVSMSALGPLYRSYRHIEKLAAKALVTADGETSADPVDFVERDAAILPAGGLDQGYKGYSLAIFTEALSAALTGYGRADAASHGDGEANALFVQVIDPRHFGGERQFKKQMSWLAQRCRDSRVLPGSDAVRMPGARALSLKRQQMSAGVIVASSIIENLKSWAELYRVRLPREVSAISKM